MHSFTSLLADLATICANHIQPADDTPAFTMTTTPTPLQRRAFNTTTSPTATAWRISTPTPPDHKTPGQNPHSSTNQGELRFNLAGRIDAIAELAQVGAIHSGAVGACLVVPFAMLGARIKTSQPAIVMMLAAFWALVPGALSFEELGRAAAGAGDISTLGVTVAAIFSIALGTLIGWSVFATINTRRGR